MKKHIWLAAVTALILTFGSAGPVRAEIIPAQGEGQIGLQAVVLCQDLTLRQEPNASSKAVKTLHYGDRIIVQPQTGGWAACFLSDSVPWRFPHSRMTGSRSLLLSVTTLVPFRESVSWSKERPTAE